MRTLAERLRPIVVSAWVDAKHAIFSAQAEERRRRVDSLQLKIDEVKYISHFLVSMFSSSQVELERYRMNDYLEAGVLRFGSMQ